jgi:hypothetical protein
MEHDYTPREAKHVYEKPQERILPLVAWGLVAVAMALAAIILIMGVSGLAAKALRAQPPAPATSTADVIFPPAPWKACDPIFQRCEVAR